MKKLLFILILSTFVISCSKDEDNSVNAVNCFVSGVSPNGFIITYESTYSNSTNKVIEETTTEKWSKSFNPSGFTSLNITVKSKSKNASVNITLYKGTELLKEVKSEGDYTSAEISTD
ncbi:MAG: hypothetical protein ACOYO1_05910 [Bacteroidales bacterium]